MLEVATKLLRGGPLESVTADEVAKEAGVSKGLVFHYFPNTRDMHLEVLSVVADELTEAIVTDSTLPLDEQIYQGLNSYIDYLSLNSRVYLAVARGAGGDPEMGAMIERVKTSAMLGVTSAIPVSEMPDHVRIAAYGWVSMVEECVFRWLDGLEMDRELLVEFLAEELGHIMTRALGFSEVASSEPKHAVDTRNEDSVA